MPDAVLTPTDLRAPVVTVRDDAVLLTRDAEKWTLPRSPAPGGVAGIRTYTTQPRGKGTVGVRRYGVALVDADGAPLALLAQSDHHCYAADDLRAFAEESGLTLRNLGKQAPLFAEGRDVLRIGPGTSRSGAVVAPSSQWALTMTLLAGMLLIWPLFYVVHENLTNSLIRWTLFLVLGFGLFFGGLILAAILGYATKPIQVGVRWPMLGVGAALILWGILTFTGVVGPFFVRSSHEASYLAGLGLLLWGTIAMQHEWWHTSAEWRGDARGRRRGA